MAEIKKLTKKDYFKELKEIVTEIGRTDLVDFIDHEVELLSKKSSKVAPTKTQVENEKIKEKIVATLVELNKYATITDIQNANTELAPNSSSNHSERVFFGTNNSLKIAISTLTTIELPACLYNCVLLQTFSALEKSSSSNPISLQHSLGVNFRGRS